MAKTTREDIIRQARDMFRDHGYAGFSMGDLAMRLGIKKASLYSRFSGKDELAREAMSLTLDELRAIAATGDDWLTRYRAVLTGTAGYLISARRCIGLHMLYGTDSEALARSNHDFFETILDIYTKILTDHLNFGQARALAEDSLGALEGATIWLILNDDPAPMQRAVDAMMIAAEHLAAAPERAASRAEMAAEIESLRGDVLTLRAALAGQIEAESCFR